jgi:hypothetical protein
VITGWVAGTVRARAMADRRLGRLAVQSLAASPSLEVALALLGDGPYGHDVRVGQSLAQAQHAAGATLLWNMRVLAGWLPREGVTGLRAIAAWFELLNVEAHMLELAGEGRQPAYQLGTLATAWPRLSGARSHAELRQVLATSSWGDPGDDAPHQIHVVMRAVYAERVAAAVPEAKPWAASAVALLLAHESVLAQRAVSDALRRAAGTLIGARAARATSLTELREGSGPPVRRLLAAVEDPHDLWRAEFEWWQGVERDAFALLRRPRPGSEAVSGAVALLATDAWRVAAAFELAARGGTPREAFDVVA